MAALIQKNVTPHRYKNPFDERKEMLDVLQMFKKTGPFFTTLPNFPS